VAARARNKVKLVHGVGRAVSDSPIVAARPARRWWWSVGSNPTPSAQGCALSPPVVELGTQRITRAGDHRPVTDKPLNTLASSREIRTLEPLIINQLLGVGGADSYDAPRNGKAPPSLTGLSRFRRAAVARCRSLPAEAGLASPIPRGQRGNTPNMSRHRCRVNRSNPTAHKMPR
jgi:hypothetical protein